MYIGLKKHLQKRLSACKTKYIYTTDILIIICIYYVFTLQ